MESPIAFVSLGWMQQKQNYFAASQPPQIPHHPCVFFLDGHVGIKMLKSCENRPESDVESAPRHVTSGRSSFNCFQRADNFSAT
jgi:hypothetical protein